jgi:hypothetical protein
MPFKSNTHIELWNIFIINIQYIAIKRATNIRSNTKRGCPTYECR